MAEVDIFSNVIKTNQNAVSLNTNDVLYIGAGVQVAGENGFSGVYGGGASLYATIAGNVFGSKYGIDLTAEWNKIVITTTGSVTSGQAIDAGAAIFSAGGANSILNNGAITGNVGIQADDGGNTITNSGTIAGAAGKSGAGIYLSGGGNIVSNSGSIVSPNVDIWFVSHTGDDSDAIINTGQLLSADVPVYFDNGLGTFVSLENSGSIVGTLYDFEASGGSVSVKNTGTMSAPDALQFANGQTSDIDTLYNSGKITASGYSAYEYGPGSLSVVNDGAIDGAIRFHGSLSSDKLDNSGTIHGSSSGAGGLSVVLEAGSGSLWVQNSGLVGGYNGITFNGASGTDTLINQGTIHGPGIAVIETGFAELDVTNTGTIAGGLGIVFESSIGTDTLDNSGTIRATGDTGTAVEMIGTDALAIVNSGRISGETAILFASATGANMLDNTGTIATTTQGGNAILSTGQSLAITNDGHIHGAIQFSAANDRYDGSLGHVTGVVNGNAGSDVLIGGAGDETFLGGIGKDLLRGGAGDDVLEGDGNADRIVGGSGDDLFVYRAVSDSTGAGHDTVVGFDAIDDKFVFNVTVKKIDAAVAVGTLDSGVNFNAELSAAIGTAKLHADHAVLFTASSGSLAGETFLIVDANGHAGYQAGHDYVIALEHPSDLPALTVGNFA